MFEKIVFCGQFVKADNFKTFLAIFSGYGRANFRLIATSSFSKFGRFPLPKLRLLGGTTEQFSSGVYDCKVNNRK